MGSTDEQIRTGEQTQTERRPDRKPSLLTRVWRGADNHPRVTWRIVVPVVVFAGLAGSLGQLIGAIDPDTVLITETNLPLLVGLIGAVVTELRLGNQSLADIGFNPSSVWARDFVIGILFGAVFQGAVTAAWIAIGDLSLTATMQTGVATGIASLVAVVGAVVVKFAVVALWEEYIFRSLLIRNVARGLVARGTSKRTAITASLLGVGAAFGALHAFGAAAAFTNPVFGAVQAFASVSYFMLAYAVTGRLGLSVGIHFITNVWAQMVVGEAGSGFPKLLVAERVGPGFPEMVVVLAPAVLLLAAILIWGRYTDETVWSVSGVYDRLIGQ